jgi:hypothetical protein
MLALGITPECGPANLAWLTSGPWRMKTSVLAELDRLIEAGFAIEEIRAIAILACQEQPTVKTAARLLHALRRGILAAA